MVFFAKRRLILAAKSFNQALFAIELTDVSWDFGPLAFRNVVIVGRLFMPFFLSTLRVLHHCLV
jgi:hypothetical protein